MSVLDYFNDCEIEDLHRLMLEALILPAPRDRQSALRWLEQVDLDGVGLATLWLIPALFRKFGNLLADSPQFGRMKGVCRYVHLRNNILASGGRRVIERMLDEGIDVVLFKGIAIGLKYHGNIATRAMADIDVLVRRDHVPRADEIMRQCGYRHHPIMDLHSHDYVDENGCGLDLHWYSLSESVRPGIDDSIWERAEFFDWDGLVVKVMSPEDLLLTSIVNGVRGSPMHLHWIHDVATILSFEPAILWDTIWKEAAKRGLREELFGALRLVGSISGETVSNTLLQYLLDNDPEFHGDLLRSVIAEGWTDALVHAHKDEIGSNVPLGDSRSRSAGAGAAGLPRSSAFGAARHVRYFLDEDGAINGLSLQWRFLPRVAELFEVSDRQALDELMARHTPPGSGRVDVPAGLLTLRSVLRLPAYRARIAVIDGTEHLALAPGEVAEVELEVVNTSACCWPIAGGSAAQFGVSYHLLSEDGAMLGWDWLRTYLLKSRTGCTSFIEPFRALTCNLRIIAPETPGRYIVQLDLVHEGVRWFSAEGNLFPSLRLDVLGGDVSDCYAINGPDIVYETVDDETAIIDTTRGAYYTVSGYGSLIWGAIAYGHRPDDIVSAFAAADVSGVDRNVVVKFIDSLSSATLIAPSKRNESGTRGEFCVDSRFGTRLPVLTRHADLRELLAMNPLRGASERDGWPHPPEVDGCPADGATATIPHAGEAGS